MTAENPAAASQTAQKLGGVANADLAQLYPGAELACQILDQLTEVHTSVCGKIEYDLVPVEGVFNIYKLHIQSPCADLLLCNGDGYLFFFTVLRIYCIVFFCCHTDYGL